ncbi:TPA: hypothetical protein I7145_13165 [Vibrio vulnificus]|nr:hypothetical protein [Vibrio vulnificus]
MKVKLIDKYNHTQIFSYESFKQIYRIDFDHAIELALEDFEPDQIAKNQPEIIAQTLNLTFDVVDGCGVLAQYEAHFYNAKSSSIIFSYDDENSQLFSLFDEYKQVKMFIHLK